MGKKDEAIICSMCEREIQIIDNVLHGGMCTTCWLDRINDRKNRKDKGMNYGKTK